METSHIIGLTLVYLLITVLIFYVLYLFGGMYKSVKLILEKVEKIEKKLEQTS